MNKKTVSLWGINVSYLTLLESAKTIIDSAKNKKGLTVLCCSMNDVVVAKENKEVRKSIKQSDLITPDGMPLVWLLKLLGKKAERVYGPDLMELILEKTRDGKVGHFLLGTTDEKLKKLNEAINKKYKGIKVKGMMPPPFKEKFDSVDIKTMTEAIKKSGARIVWIGVSSPKQIILARQLKEALPDRVYLAVGAAFDFLAGIKKQAPRIIRQSGFEWFYRLIHEPKRLSARYNKIILFILKEGLKFNSQK